MSTKPEVPNTEPGNQSGPKHYPNSIYCQCYACWQADVNDQKKRELKRTDWIANAAREAAEEIEKAMLIDNSPISEEDSEAIITAAIERNAKP